QQRRRKRKTQSAKCKMKKVFLFCILHFAFCIRFRPCPTRAPSASLMKKFTRSGSDTRLFTGINLIKVKRFAVRKNDD
ncbi:MAG TPA: hypothetical protein VF721_03165, partial [Pyrinomonadaceae bacterium]